MAPHFTVETMDNERFEFDPRDLQRPVILISFRGGWCPYCNMHLSELRHAIPEISNMGIDVLFLSGDRSELLVKSLSRETQEDIDGLGYTIVSDANAQAAIALGIAFKASDRTIQGRLDKGDDIERSSMARHGVLPVPAVFAVNREGVITFAYANPDYKARVSEDELMAAARGLR
jgi:peroxiredoxin